MTASVLDQLKNQFHPHLFAIYKYFLECENISFLKPIQPVDPEGQRVGMCFEIPLEATPVQITECMRQLDADHIHGQQGILESMIDQVVDNTVRINFIFTPCEDGQQLKTFDIFWSKLRDQPIVWDHQELQ